MIPLAAPPDDALSCEGLWFRHAAAQPWVLRGVSVRVRPGEQVALVGPNGSGKSTFLRLCAGLLRPQRGEVRVQGCQGRQARARTAFLPQQSEIEWRFPLEVRRLVLAGRYPRMGWLKRAGRDDWRAVGEALRRMGLRECAGRRIHELSGGQRQRMLVARALVQDGGLLLLDEPFNAVDAESRDRIRAVLREVAARGAAVVVATHEYESIPGDFDRAIYFPGPHAPVPGLAGFAP